MEVREPDLTVAHQGERIGELGVVVSQRTHFGAGQLDACFEGLQDLVVVERLAILRDGGCVLLRHDRSRSGVGECCPRA